MDLLPGSDTGNDTDNITSDTTPTLRVSLTNAAVGDSVELLLDGASFGAPIMPTPVRYDGLYFTEAKSVVDW